MSTLNLLSPSRGRALAGALALVVVLLPRGPAAAQEATLVDPVTQASVFAQEPDPGSQATLFGLGGRFVGDLDGDGADEIVTQNREGTRLRVWFGSEDWLGTSAQELSFGGDLSLEVPPECLDGEGQGTYIGLGDLDGDGFEDLGLSCWGYQDQSGVVVGGFLIWLGQPRPWSSSLESRQ